MIGVSGHVDDQIIKEARELGFEDVLMAPLTMEYITDTLIPMLEKRKSSIEHKDMVLEYINKDTRPKL